MGDLLGPYKVAEVNLDQVSAMTVLYIWGGGVIWGDNEEGASKPVRAVGEIVSPSDGEVVGLSEESPVGCVPGLVVTSFGKVDIDGS